MMNRYSLICNFIKDNPDDWREKLDDKLIRIKEEEGLAIFNYVAFGGAETADFSDPVVQEARGIIINTQTMEVVCWPFRKFGNYGEYYTDEIDWATARVQDKVDGSIIKLWWNEEKNSWQFSTNSMINADKSPCASLVTGTYGDLIRKAENYNDIPFAELDKDNTYIFELVSPENRVVIAYPETMLWHTGTRNRLTGEESDTDIGIRKPAEYPLHSIDECIAAAEALNDPGSEVKKEGFVVVDSFRHRVKVKSPAYLGIHRLIGNGNFSRRQVLELIRTIDRQDLEGFLESYPGYAVYVAYYRYKLLELENRIDAVTAYTKALYQEYSGDRRAVAAVIAKHPLGSFGFKELDGRGLSGREWVEKMSFSQLEKLIPEYREPDISGEFKRGGN